MGKKIRKANAAQPEPLVGQNAALFGQEQSNHDSEAQHRNRVLFFHAYASEYTEPKPIARIVAFDGQNCEVDTSHPQQRFEAVGGQQASVRQVLRCDGHGDRSEQEGKLPAAQFAGKDGGLNHGNRRGKGGKESYAAEGVSERQPADLNQKR